MTYLNQDAAFRVLTAEEIGIVAGGDGPTAEETEIASLLGGDTIVYQDAEGAISSSGVLFMDMDENGYWDYAEFQSGDQIYIYDTDTNSWKEKTSGGDDSTPKTVNG